MTTHAKGAFDVKLVPAPPADSSEPAILGKFTIDKQFHGDLTAASKGEMLAAGTETKGSAGYVAIERVVGTLHGRKGAFYLQHNGIMTRGDGQLSVVVVPDSGTDELTGLAGTLEIKIEGGKHFYDFAYTLQAR